MHSEQNHIFCTPNKTIKSGRQTEKDVLSGSFPFLACLPPSASPFSPSSLSQHTSVILCNKLAVSRKVAAQRLPLLVRSFFSQGDVYSWAIYNNWRMYIYTWLIIEHNRKQLWKIQIDIICCKRLISYLENLRQDGSKLKEERKVEKRTQVGRVSGKRERGSREGEREEKERKWIDHSTLQLQ